MSILGLLPLAGAAISAIAGAGKQNKADKATDDAMRLSREDYEARQPLRDRFMQGAMAPMGQAPDLSAIFSDPGNPFNRTAPPPHMSGPLYEPMPGAPMTAGNSGVTPNGVPFNGGAIPGRGQMGTPRGPSSWMDGGVGAQINPSQAPMSPAASSSIMPRMPSTVAGSVAQVVRRPQLMPPMGGGY